MSIIPITLKEHTSFRVFDLESRNSGTYQQICELRGNAILSSIFIQSITPGSTVKVNYFDTTIGLDVGERYELTGHEILTDSAPPLSTHRILVSRIHHRVTCEVVVTGGSAVFGVYVSLVSDFPIDLKGSILNGQTGNLLQDGGLPISVYDPSDGKFYLLQGSGGSIATSSPLTTALIEHAVIAAANVEQSHIFPGGTRQFLVKSRTHGKILLSHNSGMSGSAGLTIHSGSVYESPQFAAQSGKTIYFQSPIAGLVVELESWS
jgi:hypothetical protein